VTAKSNRSRRHGSPRRSRSDFREFLVFSIVAVVVCVPCLYFMVMSPTEKRISS